MQPLNIGLAIADEEMRSEAHACVHFSGIRIALEQAHPVETLQLRRLNLDFLLMDASPGGESLEDRIRRIKAISPRVQVAVIDRALDAPMILGALRAGAEEFIPFPIGDKLQHALVRLAAQLAGRDSANQPTGKVVGFVSAQGGCGATTVACHVAAEFQRTRQHRTLLADLDLESGLVGFLMKTSTPFSVLDAAKNLDKLDPSYWKGLVSDTMSHLDVLPAPSSRAASEAITPGQLQGVFKLVRPLYGMVIVDLGRTLNSNAVALLDDLDELYLVTTPSITALFQAKRFIEDALAAGFPRPQLRLVLNGVPKDLDFRAEEVEDSLGVPVFAELSARPEVELAYRGGKLLVPSSPLGIQISEMAKKMTGARPEKPKGLGAWFGLRKAQAGYQSA
jgi:pilus assembly protein CpaE